MKHTFLSIAAVLICLTGCVRTEKKMNKDFLQVATERYSVRKFAQTPVAQELIDSILRAGVVAPTAVNSQPQKIYVVTSAEMMEKMREVSPCMYGAPHCIVACYDSERAVVRRNEGNYGDIDVTIVLTHMMLEAANLGVGTCLVGYFDPAALSAALELPENIRPVLMMPFGYPTEDCKPSDRHYSYRPIEETVIYK